MATTREEYERRMQSVPQGLRVAALNDAPLHAFIKHYAMGDVGYQEMLEKALEWESVDRQRLMNELAVAYQYKPFQMTLNADPRKA